MRSLLQIAQDSAALEELLQETGGEVDSTIDSFMEEITTGLATKADSYNSMIDYLKGSSEGFRKKSEAYRAAAKSAESIIEKMRERILTTMQIMNVEELEGKSIRFKLQNSPPSLVIEDEYFIPQEFQIVTVSPDTAKIKAALKDGINVPGAELKTSKHVRVYLKK